LKACALAWILLFFFSSTEAALAEHFQDPDTALKVLQCSAALFVFAASCYATWRRSAEDRQAEKARCRFCEPPFM
jgi:hypothetical protein